MKIILFSYLFPDIQNPNRGIFNLSRVNALKKLGCEVIVIAPVNLTPQFSILMHSFSLKELFSLIKKTWTAPRTEEYQGVLIYHPKWYRLPYLISWKYQVYFLHFFMKYRFEKIVSEFNPDLIISTWINPYGAYAKYAKNKFKIPYYALAEGSDILVQPFRYGGVKLISSIINKYCDALFVVSEDMYAKVKKLKHFENIKLLKNGFDNEVFNFDPGKRIVDEKFIYIVTVANFNYEKGHDILILAMKILGPKYKLLLIGEGPLMEKCRKDVKENSLDNNVEFAGRIDHNALPEYLRNNDIFCMPSRSEGLPAAPLEAMSMGLPVVASKVGGMQQIVIDGFNGYLCKPESPEDLAEKIKLTARQNWNKKEISEWASQNYSWDKWAKEILLNYDEHRNSNSRNYSEDKILQNN